MHFEGKRSQADCFPKYSPQLKGRVKNTENREWTKMRHSCKVKEKQQQPCDTQSRKQHGLTRRNGKTEDRRGLLILLTLNERHSETTGGTPTCLISIAWLNFFYFFYWHCWNYCSHNALDATSPRELADGRQAAKAGELPGAEMSGSQSFSIAIAQHSIDVSVPWVDVCCCARDDFPSWWKGKRVSRNLLDSDGCHFGPPPVTLKW